MSYLEFKIAGVNTKLILDRYKKWGILHKRDPFMISHGSYPLLFIKGISCQGAFQKRVKKGSKSQRIRDSAMRLCLPVMPEVTSIKSHKHELNRNKAFSQVDGGKSTRSQPYKKN